MRLLDLCCGAGGASRGYALAGITDIVGVDINPQPNYPYEFVQADALTYPLDGFDVVHASPPCQRWSSKTRNPDNHPDLIAPLRERFRHMCYVIENVPRAPLICPVRLCGSMFALGVRRHRMFETSFLVPELYCSHYLQPERYRIYNHGKWYLSRTVAVYGTGGGKGKEYWGEAMGIDWMSNSEMVQAIPPAYTEYIGSYIK